MLIYKQYLEVEKGEGGNYIKVGRSMVGIVDELLLNGMDVIKLPIRGRYDPERNIILSGKDYTILLRWVGKPTLSLPSPKVYAGEKLVEIRKWVLGIYKARGRGRKECQDIVVVSPTLPVIIEDWDMTLLITNEGSYEYYTDFDVIRDFMKFADEIKVLSKSF